MTEKLKNKNYKNFKQSLQVISNKDKKFKYYLPASDIKAWSFFKKYNFIYNKIFICQSQEIDCGPYGITPVNFPVVIKPIVNLYGMSKEFKIIYNLDEFNKNITDGLFWMKYYSGENYNLDIILKKGKIFKYLILFSKTNINKPGTFEYHTNIELDSKKINLNKIDNWIKKYLSDFTGIINMEIINNKIIEVHLRPNGDFFFYNEEKIKNIVNLFKYDKWSNFNFEKIYLFPIFIDTDKIKNININKKKLNKILNKNEIISINFDSINAKYQNNKYKRLFIFSIKDYKKGKNICKEIYELINYNYDQYYHVIKMIILFFIFYYSLIFDNNSSNLFL